MIAVVLMFALTVHAVSSASCQLGWKEYKGFCYAFFTEDSLTWFDASATCLVYSARLASIENESENDFLVTELAAKNSGDTWVGGTSMLHEETWKWVPVQKPIIYTNWSDGEPNSPEKERCLELRKDTAYKWNDNLCNAAQSFICKRKMTQDIPEQNRK